MSSLNPTMKADLDQLPMELSSVADERTSNLRRMFAPRSVAVIGASRASEGMGNRIVRNLIDAGFTGSVYPVNPKAPSVCSVRAYPTITACPDVPDLAVIVVPKEHVNEAAHQCGTLGVPGLVVISAGFREAGGADGAKRERELMAIVREHDMRLIGPNCLGIINADPAVSMNATFTDRMPPFGSAAFVSQSGALGVSVLDSAREYGLGIAQFASIGNKPDVSGNDLLLLWENDPAVRRILMYVESFGNPARFREIAARITKTKPIIVVKSGRSRAGARAASSHTGALAASDLAVDALLAQSGVLRASSIDEMFDIALAFESRAMPRSRRTAVLTNAGGPGILATDALEACGLEIAELSPATVERLRPVFPAEATIANPLDMIASANPEKYGTAMRALLDDPAVDAVVPIFVPPFGVRQEDVATAIVNASASAKDKTILAVLMGRDGLPQGRADLHAVGIPTYVFPESAARALAALHRQAEWARKPAAVIQPLDDIDRDGASRIIGIAKAHQSDQLTTVEALALLAAYGIPVAPAGMAMTVGQAVEIGDGVGYPVVLKAVSRDIVHKTDVGGVRTGIRSAAALREAFATMKHAVTRRAPAARVEGYLVQSMVEGQLETIVGLHRDPSFGPLLMFGLGGVYVEVLRDVAFRLAPLSDEEALQMIGSVRAAPLFDGFRGAPPVNRAAIGSVIRRIGQLALDHPSIMELDVNPLLVSREGVMAVDARVRIAR
jgi:acetate---CoA ligase (ADP-forming)